MDKIRILIVDDLKMICKGLQEMFASWAEFEVVGFAHDGKEAIEKVVQNKPDIVLIDVLMPVMSGIEATKEISHRFADVKVIVISSFKDEPIIAEAIEVGAKGYVVKNMRAKDLALAIHSVHSGASHFAPGLELNSAVAQNLDRQGTSDKKQKTDEAQISVKKQSLTSSDRTLQGTHCDTGLVLKDTASHMADRLPRSKPVKTEKKTNQKLSSEKPLFLYGDWIALTLGTIFFSQINGMGHHLGHAGLFLLMLALVARPIRFWWDAPLKHRRTIGILAFAAATSHAIYATMNVLNGRANTVLTMTTKHQIGIVTGVISLAIMLPAAVTSFKYFQRKLGKKWKKIHLWTVPAMVLAIIHTVLIGPHYLSEIRLTVIDHLRTYSIVAVGLLVVSMRRQFFWSLLGLDKMGRTKRNKVTS